MIKVHTKVLVLRPDGKLLILKRSADDERRPGEWDFPGGGVEPGESVDNGAARELTEEANIVVPSDQLQLAYAATSFYEPTGDSNTRVVFITHITQAQADTVELSHEHELFKWQLPVDAAAEHPHPVYKAGLYYALEHKLL